MAMRVQFGRTSPDHRFNQVSVNRGGAPGGLSGDPASFAASAPPVKGDTFATPLRTAMSTTDSEDWPRICKTDKKGRPKAANCNIDQRRITRKAQLAGSFGLAGRQKSRRQRNRSPSLPRLTAQGQSRKPHRTRESAVQIRRGRYPRWRTWRRLRRYTNSRGTWRLHRPCCSRPGRPHSVSHSAVPRSRSR